MKKLIRLIKVIFGKHIPTVSYCEDRATQQTIKAAFETCTFIAVE